MARRGGWAVEKGVTETSGQKKKVSTEIREMLDP